MSGVLIGVWPTGPSLLFREREGNMPVLALSSACDWPAQTFRNVELLQKDPQPTTSELERLGHHLS